MDWMKGLHLSLFSAALIVLSMVSIPTMASEREGTVGFTVEVEGDGSFWKPLIKNAHVTDVRQFSPAAQAGLQSGDEILSIQGIKLANANAREVAGLVKVKPGEHLHLTVMRTGSDDIKEIDIVAGEQ